MQSLLHGAYAIQHEKALKRADRERRRADDDWLKKERERRRKRDKERLRKERTYRRARALSQRRWRLQKKCERQRQRERTVEGYYPANGDNGVTRGLRLQSSGEIWTRSMRDNGMTSNVRRNKRGRQDL